jgi:hypothetical protein
LSVLRFKTGIWLSDGAEAGHQGDQIFAVFFADGGKFEAHALAFARMADGGVGANGAFLDEKMEVGFGTDFLGLPCFDEGAADAQVTDAGDIVAAVTAEVDPNVGRILDAAADSFG